MKRLAAGVIFGGRSVEHDVSIVTAHQIMAQLADRHQIVPVYVTREGRWLTGPGLNDLQVYRERSWDEVADECILPPAPAYGGLLVPAKRFGKPRRVGLDVAFPAIHGTFGEDGTLQGLLELAQIPYVGSGVVGSAVGFDKVLMRTVFEGVGLPIVPGVVVTTHELDADAPRVLDRVEGAIGYPSFAKPARAGSSIGIAKATERESLIQALEVARRYDNRILVEKSMEGCIEVNCAVLGGAGFEPQVSVCEQPVAWEDFLTFSDKYVRSGKSGGKTDGMAGQDRRIPAPISEPLTKQIQDNALKAFKVVDAAGVARVDSFLREETGETWIMEINTVPGSFAFYLWEASGVSFDDLLDRLTAIALAAHRQRSELMVTFESGLLDAQCGGKTRG